MFVFANSSFLFPHLLDGTAKLIFFLLKSGIARPRKFYRGWFLPTTLYPRDLKVIHLDATGFEPGSLASFPLQATALTIMPWPLELVHFFKNSCLAIQLVAKQAEYR